MGKKRHLDKSELSKLERPEKTKQTPIFVFIFLMLIIGFLAYSNSFSNEFVWDDEHLVVENTDIETLSNIGYIFTKSAWYRDGTPTGYYRPIQTISYMIDCFLWAKTPTGYHVTNFVLQILNSIIIFFMGLMLLNERWKSFFIAAIFCVHPAFVPVVTYISGRADLLGLFFSLLTIYVIIAYGMEKKSAYILWLAVLFYPLAILSKVYFLIVPLFIVLFIFIYKDKIRLDMSMKAVLYCLAGILASYIFLRATVLNFQEVKSVMAEQPFLRRAAVFPYIITQYLTTLICPFNLGMEKKLIYRSLTEPRFVFSYIAPIIMGLAVYHFYRTKQKQKVFAIGWFLIGVIPVSNLFIPLPAIWAEHWVYVASIGMFMLLTLLIDEYGRRFYNIVFAKRVKAIFATCILAVFVVLTFKENKHWKDEESIFTRTLEKSPYSEIANFAMGRIYQEKGDYQKAIELYSVAIKEFRYKNADLYGLRGMLYMGLGNMEKAREDLETALQIEPSDIEYRNNLGGIYAQLGMYEEARKQWAEVLRIDSDNELARDNLNILNTNRRE